MTYTITTLRIKLDIIELNSYAEYLYTLHFENIVNENDQHGASFMCMYIKLPLHSFRKISFISEIYKHSINHSVRCIFRRNTQSLVYSVIGMLSSSKACRGYL